MTWRPYLVHERVREGSNTSLTVNTNGFATQTIADGVGQSMMFTQRLFIRVLSENTTLMR